MIEEERRGPLPPKGEDNGTIHPTDINYHTPLMASIDHIYAINADKGLFKKPAPMNNYGTKNSRKYCAFHDQSGA